MLLNLTLTTENPCDDLTLTIVDSAFTSPLIDYIVGSGDQGWTLTKSAVTSNKPDDADCGDLSWNIIDTDTNSDPNPSLFFIDTEERRIVVNTDDVSLIKTYNLQL